ncbi:UNVERIFIED_CONTAM: hypothetical protein FKN15_008573 [Acipenser sinensis]
MVAQVECTPVIFPLECTPMIFPLECPVKIFLLACPEMIFLGCTRMLFQGEGTRIALEEDTRMNFLVEVSVKAALLELEGRG